MPKTYVIHSTLSSTHFHVNIRAAHGHQNTLFLQDHLKGKRPAKAVSLSSALLKKSGPPPALPPRPGAAGASPSAGGASLGLGPTSISGGFGSNGSSGTGGFGSNGGGGSNNGSYNPRAYGGGGGGVWGGGGGAGTASPPLPLRAGAGATVATAGGGKDRGKAAPDLAHCFELHSGKLLGDKRNREGRLYFKVWHGLVGAEL